MLELGIARNEIDSIEINSIEWTSLVANEALDWISEQIAPVDLKKLWLFSIPANLIYDEAVLNKLSNRTKVIRELGIHPNFATDQDDPRVISNTKKALVNMAF